MQRFSLILSLLPLLAASRVLAHPGHGNSANGLLHYLTEPEHLLGMVALLLGMGGLVYGLKRLRRYYG